MPEKLKITNCHTHIFTADQVPPLLGKTLIPWPLFYLANINWLIALVRSVNSGKIRAIFYQIKVPVDRIVFWYQGQTEHWLLTKVAAWIFKLTVTVLCGLFMLSFLRRFFEDQKGLIRRGIDFVFSHPFLVQVNSIHWGWKLVILVLSIIFFKWVRNLAMMMLFAAMTFLKGVLGSANVQLLKRYYNIAILCRYKRQRDILGVLQSSYPEGTKFVILPMDLDYARAGLPKQHYPQQLAELIKLKNESIQGEFIKPFVFADPRRIEADPSYYQTIVDCLEKKNFSGIKIYPALGYYPFDKNLLELFLYACEKEVPIMTHCIRGVIFYRGMKKKAWDRHPVFEENDMGTTKKLRLKQFDNVDYINNFTHPLNYLCLLDPVFLKVVLFDLPAVTEKDKALTEKLYELYGFTKGEDATSSTLQKDLKKLKICFGHFGGEDEWARYITRDRDDFDNDYITHPSFYHWYKNPIYRNWKEETWYSHIRSIMMNPAYPNVYADISFILYDEAILSLLKATLQVDGLKDRILYGTDFYVVRQKGTDKKLWTDIQAHLSIEELKLIAQANPDNYLRTLLAGSGPT